MNDPMEQAGLGVGDPIPTDFGDIEDERHTMEGLGRLLMYALCIVSFIAVCVMAL